MEGKRIIISRTDSIGDVVLTLPLAGFLKKQFPTAQIIFLGRLYTKPVVNCCVNVDEFADWSQVENLTSVQQTTFLKQLHADTIVHVFPNKAIAKAAKNAKINWRIGTSGRWYHWLYANKLVKFSRRKSNLHESQLNFKLLGAFGLHVEPKLTEMTNFLNFRVKNESKIQKIVTSDSKFKLIIHPKSKGSAVEWPKENYLKLIQALPQDKFHIFITGTEAEGKRVSKLSSITKPNVTLLFGALSLHELIGLINACDGLLAASTGPLQIAGILNKLAIGLFVNIKPMHPGRWAPLGNNTKIFMGPPNLSPQQSIESIQVEDVKSFLVSQSN